MAAWLEVAAWKEATTVEEGVRKEGTRVAEADTGVWGAAEASVATEAVTAVAVMVEDVWAAAVEAKTADVAEATKEVVGGVHEVMVAVVWVAAAALRAAVRVVDAAGVEMEVEARVETAMVVEEEPLVAAVGTGSDC